MTPSQLPGYLGREIPEALPSFIYVRCVSVWLSSSEEEDLCHNHGPVVNSSKNMVMRIIV